MIGLRPGLKVLVARRPVDFRKGVHSLVALVAEALEANPYCGDVFVFRARRMDRLRLIAWDGSGMVMVSKQLEAGRFAWPEIADGAVHLTSTQLSLLVEGLEWSRASPRPVRRPTKVG